MVSALDDAVGMVVEELKRTGMFDNTIIVFTADVSIVKYSHVINKLCKNIIKIKLGGKNI